LVHLPAPEGSDLSPLFAIEDSLIEAIEASGAGEFDGNEIGQGQVTLYMYGPDADRLFAAIEPVLVGVPLPPGCVAVKRYGEPGAREEVVELGDDAR
jgi:hypothetical protein